MTVQVVNVLGIGEDGNGCVSRVLAGILGYNPKIKNLESVL